MTEKANPSVNRPAEAYKTAGAIAYGGHGKGGFIQPGSDPTEISVQDAGIDHTVLSAFSQSFDQANSVATISPGEAFVFGTWLATDETYTVSLSPDASGQTVYVGWNKSGPNDVIIGLQSAFSESVGDTDEKIPLYTYNTIDGSEEVTDERTIGYTEYIEGKSFYGNEDFSLSYNSNTDELEIVDEVNGIVKASFDKNGDVHITNGDLDLQADLRDGTTTIYDNVNGYLPQARLENDSITVSDGDGIVGSSISLGGSAAIDVSVADIVGSYLQDDGTNNIEVNTGAALGNDGTGSLGITGDSAISWSAAQTFNGGVTMGSDIDLGGTYSINNVPIPTSATQIAPKEYVDSVAEGLNIKESVAVSNHDGNIDLTSTTDPNPIDGYTLTDGERILLKHQTDATENGIYDAVTATDPSTWVRSSDLDEDAELSQGVFTFIRNGTHANEAYVIVSPDPLVVGTDPMQWSQFSFAGELSAGTNLSKVDSTISLNDSISLAGSISTASGQSISSGGDISASGSISATNGVNDSSGNKMLNSVAASGQVTLTNNLAEVSTSISATDATFMLALGIDDPNADSEVAGSLFWDDSAGNYEIRIRETETNVNPTVNYDIIRVR